MMFSWTCLSGSKMLSIWNSPKDWTLLYTRTHSVMYITKSYCSAILHYFSPVIILPVTVGILLLLTCSKCVLYLPVPVQWTWIQLDDHSCLDCRYSSTQNSESLLWTALIPYYSQSFEFCTFNQFRFRIRFYSQHSMNVILMKNFMYDIK